MEGVWCFIFCFGISNPPEQPKVLDSYCLTYQRIVKTSADLDQIKKLNRPLRDLIQGNELEYLCRCKGWKTDPKKKAACK